MGQIQWYKDDKGEFRWRLKATNGRILASGEGFKTKAGMMNSIRSIMINLEMAWKEGDIKQVWKV